MDVSGLIGGTSSCMPAGFAVSLNALVNHALSWGATGEDIYFFLPPCTYI